MPCWCNALGPVLLAALAAARPTKYPPPPEADPRRLQKAADTVCRNLAGWTDSGGLQCFHYASNRWCTPQGKAGSAWKREWGEIGDYASDGADAFSACCACGGGTVVAACTGSLNRWEDSEGQSCEAYEENHWCTAAGDVGINWVASWGSLDEFASKGKTPQEACCACGRGQSGICKDLPHGWEDTDKDTCAHYEDRRYCTIAGEEGSGWKDRWGALTDYSTGGVSALTACCTCGGGCYDDPMGWTDIYGVTCEEYAANAWCSSDGSAGEGWRQEWGAVERSGRSGRSALTACCECGGGSTSSPTLANKPVCYDAVPGWRDSEGDTCLSYAAHRWCSPYGSPGSGWNEDWGEISDFAVGGESAYSACCGCGSGCEDTKLDWADPDGDTCAFYVANQLCTPEGGPGSGWRTEWGSIVDFASDGHSALDVCCGCGGGNTSSRPAFIAPTPSPGPLACTDLLNPWGYTWRDSWWSTCDYYERVQLCSPDGSLSRYWSPYRDRWTRSALEMCCACGGGCVDVAGWADSYGAGCEDYEENLWCTDRGFRGRNWKSVWGSIEDYAVGGFSAIGACCTCGGGMPLLEAQALQTTTSTTAPPPPASVTGSLALSVESPGSFLQEGEDKAAMEGFVTEMLSETLGVAPELISANIVGGRRLAGDPRRSPPAGLRPRRLQASGIITVEFEVRLPEGLGDSVLEARKAELRASVAALTPESTQAVLQENVKGRYNVQVLSVAEDPEPGALQNPEKMSDAGSAAASKADAVVIVAVVGIVLFSCCLGCMAVRIFWRACRAAKGDEEPDVSDEEELDTANEDASPSPEPAAGELEPESPGPQDSRIQSIRV